MFSKKAANSSSCFIKALAAVLALSSLIAGCLPVRWHRIQPGMTKRDVVHYVGEPVSRGYEGDLTLGSKEIWFYDTIDNRTKKPTPHWVRFVDGRVIDCQFDAARFKQLTEAAAKPQTSRQ